MSAASGVIAKPGYSQLTIDANGWPTSRVHFEEILMVVWNSIAATGTDDFSVTPTTMELQRLYDFSTPENGDPSASDAFLASIAIYQFFLETPTDSRWTAYIQKTKTLAMELEQAEKDSNMDLGASDLLTQVADMEKALSGEVVPNILPQQYSESVGARPHVVDSAGNLLKVPAAGGLPSTDSNQASLIELYIGYFNRAPEAQGLRYWEGELQSKLSSGLGLDASLSEIANQFWPAAQHYEHITGYRSDMSTFDFVGRVYANVLGRPDAVTTDIEGITFWTNQLQSGAIASRGEFIIDLIKAAHSYIDTFQYDPISIYVDQYLTNRTQISSFFAQDEYSGHLSGDAAVNAGIAVLSGIDESAASVQNTIAQLIGVGPDALIS